MMNTDTKNIVIIGSSGHAKVVVDCIEREGKYRIEGLIDSSKPVGEMAIGYQILGTEENLPELVEKFGLWGGFIAIGDNWKRFLVAQRIKALLPTFEFISTIHPSAQIARGVSIGCGTVLLAGAIVNSDSKIGDFCILNTKASLDHDSGMEDFASLAPGATTGGNVRIGAYSAVSIGASILHQRQIGQHTLIGAGAVVMDNLPDFCVAYGTPAKVIRERQQGDPYL
ncbi:MAG: acetyltransferase [Anaerolineaceae bacterium]|nr:acetyltransferase [Anaerolineaceae bacterium]